MPTLILRIAIGIAVCLALSACSKKSTTLLDIDALCSGCNVVLISMDTVRADHLSTYGYARKTSPNVDRLAKESAVFEQAISQSSWTLPAHGSMMTGLYPGRLGVAHYPARRRLPEGPTTLAQSFKNAGYATGGFTGGGFVSAHFGFNRGFDVYQTDGRRFEHNSQEARGWLQQNKNRRFFMFFHGYDAHRPYFSTPSDKVLMGIPEKSPIERRGFCLRGRRNKPPAAELEEIVRYYDAAIHHGDREVGKLLRKIKELGLEDKTVLLIPSDHGEEFFEHGNCDHVRFLYKEVVHVPLILHVPGLTPAGRRVRQVVPASISVARTLLDVTGVPHNMPGASLAPILHGEYGLFNAVYSEANSPLGAMGGRGETIAMTTADHKLISYLSEGTDEAYDRVRDLSEQHVLPESDPAYLKRKTMRAWHDSLVALPKAGSARDMRGKDPAIQGANSRTAEQSGDGEEAEDLPSEIEEQLRALGYLDD
jgi:arylsulfatase A-like enzyme